MESLETTTQWIEKILNHQGFAAIDNHTLIKFPGGYLQTFTDVPGAAHVFVYLYKPIILESNCIEEIEHKRDYTIKKSESEYSVQEIEFFGEYILSIVRRRNDFRHVMADLKQKEIFDKFGKFTQKYRHTKLISGVILMLFDQKYFNETDANGNPITLVTIMRAFKKQFNISSLQPIYRSPSECADYADIKVPIIGIQKRERLKHNLTLNSTNP